MQSDDRTPRFTPFGKNNEAVTIHVVVSGETLARIDDRARSRQLSRSAVAREILARHFQGQTDQPTPATSAA